ncbi:DsbA family protein [Streptomyces sp. HNM0663]|uniref:DsbA family protein n=1 Tax=Streptomyces chengmaiensis TaxID=3040919 RepID=A0ABT6HIE6_9ACTN|nr:DsbA family protein [Streptomyces chengmaiensis]MDH2388485.1 DsbA family protein [Streptomyces chengmaiensis]
MAAAPRLHAGSRGRGVSAALQQAARVGQSAPHPSQQLPAGFGAQEPKGADFRGYAGELGLDMARYDADVATDRTAERVALDQRDGMGLGVQGAPTFFTVAHSRRSRPALTGFAVCLMRGGP